MPDDSAYADLLDNLSPLTKNNIDPDEARMDRAGTMAKLLGPSDDAEEATPWYQPSPGAEEAEEAPQQAATPQVSQNGNALPPGLQSRQTQPAAAPTPAVPASVTPSGDATTTAPDLAAQNTQTIGLGNRILTKAAADVDAEAAQPDLADQTKVLEQQRVNAQRRQVQLQKPYDPQTGKLLDEYKPSIGQRIMRGVDGFARGGVFGAIDPKLTGGAGYGDPNKYLGMDRTAAAGQVAGADQQLANAAANWKAKNDRLKAVAADRRALGPILKDVTSASTEQQGIPIKQQEADTGSQNADSQTAEAYNRSPEAKAAITQSEFESAQKQADKLGLKGQTRTLFLANGKIPDPRQATEDEIATSQATRAFTQENGHPPQTLADYAAVRAAAKGNAPPLGSSNFTSGTKGDDFLKTLPAGMQSQVKAMANGDIAMPTASSRAPGAQAIRQAVMNYDPSFTDARYKAKQTFKTGKDSDDMVSLGTAMEHLDNATKHSKDVGFAPLLSKNATGSDATYNKDMQLFSEETGKLIKSGVVNKEELEQLQSGINDSRQYVRDAALKELANLLAGKVSAKFQKYKHATGQELPVEEFFNKPTQERLKRYSIPEDAQSGTASGNAKKWDDYPEAK